MSYEVLARIVEITSGVDFDAFIADRITKPLNLKDTAYWIEGAERQARIAEPQIVPETGKRPLYTQDVTKKKKLVQGSSGLASTAHDYARFCLMLLYGGTRDGVRLVSPKTIEHMTSNHIPPGYKYAIPIQNQIFWPSPSMETGQGFGLGFAINCEPERNPLPGSKGIYYWSGAYGTTFFIDPKEELIAIIMTQAPGKEMTLHHRLRYYVYQAIGN